jgi:hypothetical protein
MRARWQPVVIVALALFGVDIVARLVIRLGGFSSEGRQSTVGGVAVAALFVVVAATAAWWSTRFRFGRVLADLGIATVVAALLSVLVGPFVSDSHFFSGGLGYFVGLLLLFVGAGLAGTVFGFWITVALGKDWRSRGLRRYSENYRAKPHRAVRR